MSSKEQCIVSVVVVSYNTYELTRACLLSIKRFLNCISFEVVLVDNNSSDKTVEAISAQFPEVHIISNSENVGFARANNQGIEISRGEYILLLNSDAELIDNSVIKIINYMHGNLDIDIVGPNLLNIDGSIQLFSCGYFPTLLRLFNQFFILAPLIRSSKIVKGLNRYNLNHSDFVDWVSGAAMFIKKRVINKIGILDENFFMYFEDINFCLRAKKEGFNVYFKHDSFIKHKGMGSSNKANDRVKMKKRWLTNLLYFYDSKHKSKMLRKIARIIIITGILLRIIIKFFFVLLKKESRQALTDNFEMIKIVTGRE